MIGIKYLSHKRWRNHKEYPVYQVILLLIFASAIGYLKYACAEENNPKVTLNFAQLIQTASMSGFLNSVNISLPKALVVPLKPHIWRLSPDDLPVYLKGDYSARYIQVVLSDGYGYPLNRWNGQGAPWENGGKVWESYVRQVARQYRQVRNIYWDVWNEPDAVAENLFWDGTREQFFETYQTAYRVLREELGPDAVIGGPSYANFDADAIRSFLAFCHQNALQVNVLSWHELDLADPNIAMVESDIAEMRTLLKRYPDLKNQKIIINESVGRSAQHRTGDILAYLYHLEAAQADGAVKACWDALDGTNNCYNGSLDGLVDPETKHPRSPWWVYKTYADGVGTRVAIINRPKDIIVLASRYPRQVLLSDNRDSDRTPIELSLKQFGNSTGTSKQTVDIVMFPNTGEAVLEKPLKITTQTITIHDGDAVLTLPTLLPRTAYQLQFH